ncbi:MAG: hypothetical protein IKK01_09220 [Clostridia bacterium]|nr:hypothetical protein [Clostridia bacterium]
MRTNDLYNRLLMLDEEASLLFDDEERFYCIIVGGSALLLLGYVNRATHDIDSIDCHHKLVGLIEKYDINMQVRAHLDCFPEDYAERINRLDLPTKKIDYYTLSLEDLVISKLLAGRSTDMFDIRSDEIIRDLDFAKLDALAEAIMPDLLNDRIRSEFEFSYNEYCKQYRKE